MSYLTSHTLNITFSAKIASNSFAVFFFFCSSSEGFEVSNYSFERILKVVSVFNVFLLFIDEL